MNGEGQPRPTEPRSGNSVGVTIGLVVIALASLAAGGGLLYVRHVSLRNLEDAKSWVETPCVIEQCEFVAGDDDDQSLSIRYRYEIDGREYHGDNLDPIVGRMGDDDEFEERVHRWNSVGKPAVCYVDPADPARSVFDREHGADAPRRMWLLAFPFACVGMGFCFAILGTLIGGKSKPDHETDADGEPETSRRLQEPPPRTFPLLTRLSVIAGPSSSQLPWLFVVGFAYVFILLDGPAAYASLFHWNKAEVETNGLVMDTRDINQHELGADIYQVKVTYDIKDASYESYCYVRGDEYSKGNIVTVTYDPANPGHGLIPGARRSSFTWWHSAVPLGVLLLLGLGLMFMYRRNYHVYRLLKNGLTTRARWNPNPNTPDDALQAATLVTNYQFDVAGRRYSAMQYAAPSKMKRRGARPRTAGIDEVHVLYNPRNPKRNVIVDPALIEMIDDDRAKGDRIMDCATAPLAMAMLLLLVHGAGLM